MQPHVCIIYVEFLNACSKTQNNKDVSTAQQIAATYQELKNELSKQPLRPKKCFPLDELAILRLVVAMGENKEIKYFCNDLKFYKDIKNLVGDQGISGEWAFTVLNYLLAVHGLLVRFDATKAFLIRNFIVKNFAYKLRGPKRIAFMATLFVGLQYDCQFENGERWVLGIGEYFFEKFLVQKYVKISECRVYLAFVMLCFAHIYEIIGKKEKHNAMFSAYKALRKVNVCHLWEYIDVLFECVSLNKYKRTANQVRFLGNPDCINRSEIAFVHRRLQAPAQLSTESVNRWLRYITVPDFEYPKYSTYPVEYYSYFTNRAAQSSVNTGLVNQLMYFTDPVLPCMFVVEPATSSNRF